MAQNTSLEAMIRSQRAQGMKGTHWDNHAVARYTLEGELGKSARHVFDLDQDQVNTLLVHGRQDAA
jgi:hypothetical protein